MSRRVAIVYDWADTRYGGAEQVLLALAKLYPGAVLVTSFADFNLSWLTNFADVRTSFLQSWPRILKKHKVCLAPFLPMAFEQFRLDEFELVISVSSFAAKGVLTKPHQRHICYLLTPTRFLYSHRVDYRWGATRWSWPVRRYLLAWDQVAAHRPDQMLAISQTIADRCQQYYARAVDVVIYPSLVAPRKDEPMVSEAEWLAERSKLGTDRFFVCVSRLTTYKKIDWCVRACGEAGATLVVVGDGPQLPRLRQLASRYPAAQIIFRQNLSPKWRNLYYNKALALLAPAWEDFGINLLEANQQGTLVVTHPRSGARELLDERMAIDLEVAAGMDNLRSVVKELLTQGKRTVPVQPVTDQTFAREWLKKAGES